MEYAIAPKTNTTKKLTPPKDGFDSLLQRITTSFLFLIPKDLEKRSNNMLQKIANKAPPIPKPSN
jgi:hypothetical protein